MGRHIPRTAADERQAAQEALAAAEHALRDLRSHLDTIIANPEGADGKARAARRNSDIIAASLEAAGEAVRASGRIQFTSVS